MTSLPFSITPDTLALFIPYVGIAVASFVVGYTTSRFFTNNNLTKITSSSSSSASTSSTPLSTTKSTTSSTKGTFRKPTTADIIAAEKLEDAITDSPYLPSNVELKMVICVRQDLGMSKGKVAAQTAHAALGAYKLAKHACPEYVRAWEFRAQAKITLRVDDEATMDAIAAEARKQGLPYIIIEDAGRTEVEPGTRTVLGIGPAPREDIDMITGPKGKFPLKLYA